MWFFIMVVLNAQTDAQEVSMTSQAFPTEKACQSSLDTLKSSIGEKAKVYGCHRVELNTARKSGKTAQEMMHDTLSRK